MFKRDWGFSQNMVKNLQKPIHRITEKPTKKKPRNSMKLRGFLVYSVFGETHYCLRGESSGNFVNE